MRYRQSAIAVLLVVVAIAVQTTLFARLRPFDAAPALVVLMVIAVSRHLDPEVALIVGFGAGVTSDLLGESPLGLWALVMTGVAYAVVRLRDRFEDDYTLLAPGVFIITLAALTLFATLGTIFGEKTLADSALLRKMLLPSLYNVALGIAVLPTVTIALGRGSSRSGWDL